MTESRTEPEHVSERWDNPLERLSLLAGNEAAMSAFLDELDVRSPTERTMLSEIARKEPLARPERFLDDHRRAVAAIESLRRRGFHGTRAGRSMGRSVPWSPGSSSSSRATSSSRT